MLSYNGGEQREKEASWSKNRTTKQNGLAFPKGKNRLRTLSMLLLTCKPDLISSRTTPSKNSWRACQAELRALERMAAQPEVLLDGQDDANLVREGKIKQTICGDEYRFELP